MILQFFNVIPRFLYSFCAIVYLGLAAYELGSSLIWIMSKNKVSGGAVQNPYLFEAIKCFEKAAEILSFEPSGSNNYSVGESAEKELVRIKAELPTEN